MVRLKIEGEDIMRKTVYRFAVFSIIFSVLTVGCQNRAGEKEPEGASSVNVETSKSPIIGPHKAGDIRKWIADLESKASEEALKKVEGFAGKFTAGEIISGLAVRPVPDYWEKVDEAARLKTVSIMNTGFSKIRIKAGLAEDSGKLNSSLYLEDKEGNIIAVSDKLTGPSLYDVSG